MSIKPESSSHSPAVPSSASGQPFRVAVIGGGAAGFFAAINIAEKCPHARVVIFEASAKPLQKVRISGGGRCNVTHACFEPARLVEYYPRGFRELRSLFARFQPKDMIQWLEKRGVKLKTEADGRIFPTSDQSESIIALFQDRAKQLGVSLRTQQRIQSIEKNQNDLFEVQTPTGLELFEVCILATGYSPPGWKLAESLGHKVIPPVPSLFPLTVESSLFRGLQGLSFPAVAGTLIGLGERQKSVRFEAEGPLLITHTGLSGPLIYRLSAKGARLLALNQYQTNLRLNFVPECSQDALREMLKTHLAQAGGKKQIANVPAFNLPVRFWQAVLRESQVPADQTVEQLGKKAQESILQTLTGCNVSVTGRSPSKEEFVSCGGVPLKEVDMTTMQSKKVPGLFFAGEILDIDGLTGGFNFQACWSGAWVLSEALAKTVKANVRK